jgi:hypothetical protein
MAEQRENITDVVVITEIVHLHAEIVDDAFFPNLRSLGL